MTSSMYIMSLLLALGIVPNVLSSCPENCTCSEAPQRSVSCRGHSLSHVTSLIPSDTVSYQYKAHEELVNLGGTNFSHLTSLEEFNLMCKYDDIVLERTIKELNVSEQQVFWPLVNLKKLRININWALKTPLPELFSKMEKLEVLDISNTRIISYTNLAESLAGLENSTAFQVLIMHNSQTLEILKNGFTLNISKLLDPIKNCPLDTLDISYNALRTVIPGLLSKAKKLKTLDASNNLLIPLLSSVFFLETVIHPTLDEADFSEQGYGMVKRSAAYSSTRTAPNWMIRRLTPDTENLDSENMVEMNMETQDENGFEVLPQSRPDHPEIQPHRIVSNSESEVNTIRRASQLDNLATSRSPIVNNQLLHANTDCLDRIMVDFCNVFSPECAVLLHNCTVNHELFCKILNEFVPHTVAIPCDMIPPIEKLIRRNCGGCLVFPLLGSIRVLHLQKLNNYDEALARPIFKEVTCFHGNNSLEVLDFSKNREHGYADIDLTFSSSVVGFDRLTVMNLTKNKIRHLSPDMGTNLPEIQVLDLSNNLLDLQGKYGEFIVGAANLRELNLAGNVIENITYDRFTTLAQLITLNLSSNMLQDFSVDLRNLTHLASIDLSDNYIMSLSTDMTYQLTSNARVNHSTLRIDLSTNSLLCTCEVKPFIDWIRSKHTNIEFVNFDLYTCLNENSNQVNLTNFPGFRLYECLSFKVLISVGIGSGIIISMTIAALVTVIYRKRWWFRYHYFIARKMWWSSRKQERDSKEYHYDLFVSYNNHDQDWVDEELMPMLEVKHHVRLCIHDRDFRLGGDITENILESIDNSRKTLLVLTPHFVQSNWCTFEMKRAHLKYIHEDQDVLLLAILKPLSNVQISKTLKSLLERKNYVEWSENPYGQKLFWEKLIRALELPESRQEDEANEANDENVDGGRTHPSLEEPPCGAEGEGHSLVHGVGVPSAVSPGISSTHEEGPIDSNETPADLPGQIQRSAGRDGDAGLQVVVHIPAEDVDDGTDENVGDEKPLIGHV